MATYKLPDPSGSGSITASGSSLQEAESNAAAASGLSSWTGGSYGADSLVSGDSGGGGSSSAPQTAYGGVSGADLSKIQAGFAASSGMTQKQLDETIREFDANLEWQKQMWQQQGLPQLAIAQKASDLEQQKFAELTAQANRQQNFVEEQGRAQTALAQKAQADANAIASGQLSLAQLTQAQNNAVARGSLGLDTLKTAASLSGPADWIKASNFARGASQSVAPQFVQDLLSGRATAPLAGPAPGATMSAPVTMASLGNAVTSGATGPDATYGNYATTPGAAGAGTTVIPAALGGTSAVDYAKSQLGKVFAAGGQALGPQQMEGMTPTETSMFTGGGADIGADVPGFVAQYQRSRIGQSSGTPSYMASGGVVTKPTLAVIGEQGPEAIVPLNPQNWNDITPRFESQTTIPPPPMQFPNFVRRGQQATPTYNFESPDQVITMADNLGLQGPERTAFIQKYLNPMNGPRLGRYAPQPEPVAVKSQ